MRSGERVCGVGLGLGRGRLPCQSHLHKLRRVVAEDAELAWEARGGEPGRERARARARGREGARARNSPTCEQTKWALGGQGRRAVRVVRRLTLVQEALDEQAERSEEQGAHRERDDRR